MRKNNRVTEMVKQIDRRKLSNNTQRVLLALLQADAGEWVARTSFRVPSASSRLRDLRTSEFGGFEVQCVSSVELQRVTRKPHQTFYRLNPRSVTPERVAQVFKGVI